MWSNLIILSNMIAAFWCFFKKASSSPKTSPKSPTTELNLNKKQVVERRINYVAIYVKKNSLYYAFSGGCLHVYV